MNNPSFINILVSFLPLIIAVVIHEAAHGLAADKLGDDTARRMGRITLNPLKHIDPFLTIVLPAVLIFSGSPVIFGGAKPVPVNVFRLRKPKRDMALVAAAGPASNFLLAGAGIGLVYLCRPLLPSAPEWMIFFALQWILINVVLAVFNLFPLPPLDGGRIAVGLLPSGLARYYARIERYGFLILILLLFSGVINQYLTPVLEALLKFLDYLLSN